MELSKVQDLIKSNNGHQNYDVYRNHELSYWEHIKSWIDDSLKDKDINILDIGCAYGTLGLYTKLNTNGNLYCVDFIKYMVDELIEKFGINYQILNFEKDSLPWNIKFDVIIFTEILEHLNGSPVDVLNKIYGLLSDDGVLFMSTPDANKWGRLKNYSSWKDIPNINKIQTIKDAHIYQYSLDELTELLSLCGFEIERCNYSNVTDKLTNINLMIRKRSNKLTEINSKEYWDKRFGTGDWESNNGFKQSKYFAETILNNLSSKVKDNLKNGSALDYACGCGQLCDVFSKSIDGINMIGYDFSKEATDIANKLYPNGTFVYDMPQDKFDAIVFSHVLEHMDNGVEMVEGYSQYVNKYLIISTPWKEDKDNLVKEHVVSIDENYFPDSIGKFKQIEKVIVDTRDSGFWHGDVIVVVYKRVENREEIKSDVIEEPVEVVKKASRKKK